MFAVINYNGGLFNVVHFGALASLLIFFAVLFFRSQKSIFKYQWKETNEHYETEPNKFEISYQTQTQLVPQSFFSLKYFCLF
jgi:hypothetical protein